MRSKVSTLLELFLLGLGTLCGPGLWLGAIACAYTAWLPGLEDSARLELLWASFVFSGWALWGLASGLVQLPRIFLGLGSGLNLVTGFFVIVSGKPHSVPIGLLFLGYSLAQAIACTRPRVRIVS